MSTDISIVLYRPRWIDLSCAIDSLVGSSSEINSVYILLSGTDSDYMTLTNLLQDQGCNFNCIILHRYDNLGFAGGHNLLLKTMFGLGSERVLVYNPDLRVSPGALSDLVMSATSFERGVPEPCLFGPTLRCSADSAGASTEADTAPSYVDSAGIYWTASARHYDKDQGMPWRRYEKYRLVEGLTGACLLVSKRAYDRVYSELGAFFDPAFIAFREDAELGITAKRLGVQNVCIYQDGFVHNRGNPGTKRTNTLVDMLGVQNRFLLRWRLGRDRPGNRVATLFRDFTVIAATLSIERSSIPGLRLAFAIRRYEKAVSRWVSRTGNGRQGGKSAQDIVPGRSISHES